MYLSFCFATLLNDFLLTEELLQFCLVEGANLRQDANALVNHVTKRRGGGGRRGHGDGILDSVLLTLGQCSRVETTLLNSIFIYDDNITKTNGQLLVVDPLHGDCSSDCVGRRM